MPCLPANSFTSGISSEHIVPLHNSSQRACVRALCWQADAHLLVCGSGAHGPTSAWQLREIIEIGRVLQAMQSHTGRQAGSLDSTQSAHAAAMRCVVVRNSAVRCGAVRCAWLSSYLLAIAQLRHQAWRPAGIVRIVPIFLVVPICAKWFMSGSSEPATHAPRVRMTVDNTHSLKRSERAPVEELRNEACFVS